MNSPDGVPGPAHGPGTVPGGYPPELAALTPTGPGAYHTVHYGPDTNQFGELWPAAGDRYPAPVVVLVHGGYWRDRYRLDLMHTMAADLASRGFAVWNVEYRRVGSPGGGWPGTFLDVAAAFDALAGLAPEHRLDLTRIAAVGHSAGGHLALWACGRRAAARSAPALFAPPRVVPALAVSLAGVCDLCMAADLGLSDNAVRGLLGGGPEEIPEVYDAACPAHLLPLGVPQVVLHGTGDVDVPLEVSTRYARRAGAECDLVVLPGADHIALIDPVSAAWPSVLSALASL